VDISAGLAPMGRAGEAQVAVLRGLVEALLLCALGLAVAAVGAGIWTIVDDGGFGRRFGLLLVICGIILAVTGGGFQVGRLATRDVRAFVGVGLEREGATGGRVLTSLGLFLFVSVPLMVVGVILMG
jgi:hypothetical protein